MKLGKFIEKFSHNNLVRLLYKCESGHEIVLNSWNDVSMDWEINKQQGKFRSYIDNEVLGIASILTYSKEEVMNYPEAINIVIEKKEDQLHLEEIVEEKLKFCQCVENSNNIEQDVLKCDSYWNRGKWKQPPAIIKHGDLVDVECDGYPQHLLGRYIGKGYGVVELYNYATGIKHIVGKVASRGLDKNPRLISDEKLFEFIKD